jgi:Tfp pilus assembly protein PilZ
MTRRLRVPFDDLEAFRREYETHIARGGLFVPTLERFEPRELIEVQLELRFCGAEPVLQAEVVRQLRPGGGSLRGIALQLLEPTPQLRARLEALTGVARSAAETPPRPGPDRRHERHPTRLPTRLESARRAEATYTLNLSESGALLPAGEDPLPIGERVRLSLVHPRSGEQFEVDARVVRHELRDGRVEHIAVEFASDLELGAGRSFLESSVAAAHARAIGRVEGDLAAMNPAALLQMLPASASEGTLVLRAPQPGRIGCVLFRGGALALVSLGRLRGAKALSRLLAWEEGHFEYAPSIEPDEDHDETAPLPLPGALLEALQHHDELRHVDRSALPGDALIERLRLPGAGSDKLQDDLLGMLERPRRTGELVDASPAYDVEVYRALLALLDAGAIALRPAPPRA